jgi:hypothetical protein
MYLRHADDMLALIRDLATDAHQARREQRDDNSRPNCESHSW